LRPPAARREARRAFKAIARNFVNEMNDRSRENAGTASGSGAAA